MDPKAGRASKPGGLKQPEAKVSYCIKMLDEVQQGAVAKGHQRVTMRELDRIRASQKWGLFTPVRSRDADDERQLDGMPAARGEQKSSQAAKEIPDINLLQASAGLLGGGVAGRRRRAPKTIGWGVRAVVRELGLESFFDEANLRANWEKIIGPELAQHVKIETIRNREMVVRCDSTAWATQLRLLIPQMLAAIQANTGHLTIEKLYIKGPEQPSWKHGPRSVKGRGPRDTYG